MNDKSNMQVLQILNEYDLSDQGVDISLEQFSMEQKKIFELYDKKFDAEGLQGDQDEEIYQPSIKESNHEINQIKLDISIQIDQDKPVKAMARDETTLIQQEKKQLSQKTIPARHQARNPSYFASNLNNGRLNMNNSNISSVIIPLENSDRRDVFHRSHPQASMIGLADKQDQNIKQDQQSIRTNICQHIIKQTLEKNIFSQQALQFHASNFIQLLKLRWKNRILPNNFTPSIFKLINDRSSAQVYTKSSRIDQNDKGLSESFNDNGRNKRKGFFQIPVFLPFKKFFLAWDIFQIIISIIFLYVYSILLFFGQHEQTENEFITFFQITTTIFGLDILISLNTAYFYKDLLVTDKAMIAVKYFKTYFLYDAISFSFLIQKVFYNSGSSISYNPSHDILKYIQSMLIFLKIYGLPKKRTNIQNSIILKSHQKHLLRLFDQIFFVVLAAHTVCILWNGLSIIEDALLFENTWQKKIAIQNNSYLEIYSYSLYWSVTTMSTVGYGDITPSNAVECMFVTASMVFMSCVFAYSINNIGLILQEIEKDSKDLNDKLQIIHKFLKKKCVNIELQRRVKHYLQFLSEESKDRNKGAEDQILQMLSNKLREEVLKEINQKVMNRIGIFTKNFSAKVLQELIFAIEEILVQPNQIIFKEGDIDTDQAMYFVWSGRVDICYTDLSKQKQYSNKILKTLEHNSYFGEMSFFSGQARSASARSVNLATLYKISRIKFLEILSHHFEDFERFKMIQEQMNSLNELSIIGVECYNCKQVGHITHNCPISHVYFDKQFTVLKSNYSLFQNRKLPSDFYQLSHQFHLRKRKKINSIDSSLIEISKQVSKQLKQQAVYLGSCVFKMFEKEDQNREDDEQSKSQQCDQSSEFISDTSISNYEDEQETQSDQHKIETKTKDKKLSRQESANAILTEQKSQNSPGRGSKKKGDVEKTSFFQNQKSKSKTVENDLSQQQVQQQQQQINCLIKKVEKTNLHLSRQISSDSQNSELENSASVILNNKIGNEIGSKNIESIKDQANSTLYSKHSEEMNEICTSLLNMIKLQEKQQQQLILERQITLQNQLLISHTTDQYPPNSTHQTPPLIHAQQQDKLIEFERGKIFKRFFPQNNFDKVLKNLKNNASKKANTIQVKNKEKQPVVKRRQNVNLSSAFSNKEIKIISEFDNQDLLEYINKHKPTYCSYGLFTKKSALYPLTHH